MKKITLIFGIVISKVVFSVCMGGNTFELFNFGARLSLPFTAASLLSNRAAIRMRKAGDSAVIME